MRNREINFNPSVEMNWGYHFCHYGVTAGLVIDESLCMKFIYTKNFINGSINYSKMITHLGSKSDTAQEHTRDN